MFDVIIILKFFSSLGLVFEELNQPYTPPFDSTSQQPMDIS